MTETRHIIVVGGGVFGLSGALELAQRNYSVTVFDSGSIPSPLAASTDISKIIRMDYGADVFYSSLMVEAVDRWTLWNQKWGVEVFHPDGFLLLTREPMCPGSLEYDSLQVQKKMGLKSDRITPEILRTRYPAWNGEIYKEGYFNPKGGWAESGRVVALLRRDVEAAGATVMENTRVAELLYKSGRVTGVRMHDGATHQADEVVLAAGAWSPLLSGSVARVVHYTAHPVFHFLPEQVDIFRASCFPVWSADIGKTGFYGFPLNSDGVVKVANHGAGRHAHPDAERKTTPADEEAFRAFLEKSLPALANAPIAASKTCFYSDSWDGDFYIDRDPEYTGLIHATGGSGHGFKFAPVLGELIADVVEDKLNPYAQRFAWREPTQEKKKEQARFMGDAFAEHAK